VYNDRILVIKMIPGMHTDIFDFIKAHYDGVIIESFGLGGIPDNGSNIAGKINELIEDGIVVVLTTQCLEEGVEYGIYEVGSKLPQDKVIIAGDFNTETLVAKTMIGMGSYKTIEALKAYIETPYTYLP
ncbi:MAG: L-asparaginase 1, partial [Clostridia bacterium]|nr:L-asparaginase 1 [Clostridia bacterium]